MTLCVVQRSYTWMYTNATAVQTPSTPLMPFSPGAICHFYGAVLCLDNLSPGWTVQWLCTRTNSGWAPLIWKLFQGFPRVTSGRDSMEQADNNNTVAAPVVVWGEHWSRTGADMEPANPIICMSWLWLDNKRKSTQSSSSSLSHSPCSTSRAAQHSPCHCLVLPGESFASFSRAQRVPVLEHKKRQFRRWQERWFLISN